MLTDRLSCLFILLISCLILFLSGCRSAQKSNTPPAPSQPSLLRMPIPFTPDSPTPYEEPSQPNPPPPAPAVSWFNRFKWQSLNRRSKNKNRSSQSVSQNSSGVFSNRMTWNDSQNKQNFQAYQLQNMFEDHSKNNANEIHYDHSYTQNSPATTQSQLDKETTVQTIQPSSQLMTYHQYYSRSARQPVRLSFETSRKRSQPVVARSFNQQPTSQQPTSHQLTLFGQTTKEYQEQQPTDNETGIASWSEANWLLPSNVSDWSRRQPLQRNPSNTILPVMSVPEDASSADLEQWPHLEKEIPNYHKVEELEPPVFDTEDSGIIIQPRLDLNDPIPY